MEIIHGMEAVRDYINEHIGEEFEIQFGIGEENTYFLTSDVPRQVFLEDFEGQKILTIHFKTATSGFLDYEYKCYLAATRLDGEFVGYTVMLESIKDKDAVFSLTPKSMYRTT